mgnify:CR=1 FL=1
MSEGETLCRRADGTGAVRTVLKSRIPGLPNFRIRVYRIIGRPAVGFSTLPVLRHEVPSAEGNFAVGSGRMRGLWLQAAAAGEYECTGSERSRYIGKYGFSDCFAVGAAERLLGIPGRSDRSERPGYLPHLGNGSCGFGQNSLVKWNRMSGNFSCASDNA